MIRYFRSIMVLMLLLAWAASAWAVIELEAPRRVGVGEPFVAFVAADEPIDSVRFQWKGESIEVVAEKRPEGWVAMTLLGSDVKTAKPGVQKLAALVDTADGQARTESAVTLAAKRYDAQYLTVPEKMVTPPAETIERIRREAAVVREALETKSRERLWELPFERPVPGDLSSIYGLRRFFNQKPRSPHRGIDLRAAQGDPVAATADGRVILAADHYFAGKSVYLDHGGGVVSAYFHLSEILVREGELVEKGETIGQVGSTGRVTGPHLHFGLYLLGQAVDPMPLFW